MNTKFFLTLAGVTLSYAAHSQNYCSVGTEQWIAACQASCIERWEGGDCPRTCTATAPAGFVIMNHRVSLHSQNNGGHDVSRMSSGQSFDYKRRVEQAYNYALEMAGKGGSKEAEGKIKQDMNRAMSEAESFNSSHQMIRLNVNASKHGSVIDRKGGWSYVSVDILVKCVVPPDLEQQLMSKYALQ